MEMNVKSASATIVSLIILVVLSASVLIPILSAASDDVNQTFKNEADTPDMEYDADITNEHTITLAAGVVTIDGETFTLTDLSAPTIVAASDSFVLFGQPTGGIVLRYGSTSGGTQTSLSLVLNNGTATLGGTTTVPYHFVYLMKEGGNYEYAPLNNSVSSYVNGKEFYAVGSNAPVTVFNMGKTYTAGVETEDAVNIASTEIYDDVSTIRTQGTVGSSAIQHAIVAKEVIHTVPNGSAMKALIELVPILIFASLVIATVGKVILSRD